MNDLCVVVSSTRTQEIRKALQELGFHDSNRRLKHIKTENCVAVPVTTNKTEQELEEILNDTFSSWSPPAHFEIRHVELQRSKNLLIKSPQTVLHETVKTLLESKGQRLTKELAKELPAHWEIHGDLALLPNTAFQSELWRSLGHELWQAVSKSLSCKRLAQRDVISRDGFRSPQVTLLLGDSGWVEQTDNGIRFTYDITRCMFSSGNISEKLRVARFDCTDEVVVDLYAGIGYFTLPYLVYTGVKHLHACEWNPGAVEALHKNLRLNHVEDRCTVHTGDNREVCPKGIADRVNLGLIPSSREGWIPACAALRPDRGGTLHIHYNVNTRPHGGNQTELRESVEPDQAFRIEAKSIGRPSVEHSGYDTENNIKLSKNSNSNDDENCDDLKLEPSTHKTNRKCSGLNERTDQTTDLSDTECKGTDAKTSCDNISLESRNRTGQHTELSNTECKGPDANTYGDNISLEGKKHALKWLPWSQEVALEIRTLLENMHGSKWQTEILHVEHVKSYAPHVDHVVLDLRCTPH